ncbi:MAG: IscS subfamily cysteine desulfurase [Acidobacteriota bacterium]
MRLPIYMDNHATTPVDPRVLDAMLPYFTEKFGNAASRSHSFGWVAEAAVEKAREATARLLNARSREIVFTSGATESDNLAIRGVAEAYREKGNHIITVLTEHHAVLDPCKRLQRLGSEVTFLPVMTDGRLDLDRLRSAIRPGTILISVMAANNEVGVLQRLAEIGRIAREHGVLFHTDAAQAVGKVPIDVVEMNIDLLSFSAHKLYAPKGAGFIYVRRDLPVRLAPLLEGGGQEEGLRSGTLNVPGIVGVGRACEIAAAEMEPEAARLTRYRERLKERILAELDDVHLNGHPTERLPGNLNLSFAYVEGEALLLALRDVALSSGSACTSATPEPSYVLKAMNAPDQLAHSAIRFGLGRFNTEEEVDWVAEKVIEQVKRLRASSPLYEIAKARRPSSAG